MSVLAGWRWWCGQCCEAASCYLAAAAWSGLLGLVRSFAGGLAPCDHLLPLLMAALLLLLLLRSCC